MASRVMLHAIRGPLEGQTYAFTARATFLFGRDEECQARCPDGDKTVSRRHFAIEIDPPEASLVDLGSRNGTFVNGLRYGGTSRPSLPEGAAPERVALAHGDEVRVGQTAFVLHVDAVARCRVCGSEIEDEDPLALCSRCREASATAPQAHKTLVSCDQCGQFFDVHVEDPDSAAYFCQSCSVTVGAIHSPALDEALGRFDPGTGPATFAGYEVGKILGKGATGAVYLARRVGDPTQVALKFMVAVVGVTERKAKVFEREIEVLSTLRHPNIVELFDHGACGNTFYFAMEYCAGRSVDTLLAQRGWRLPWREAVPIILQALDALAYAHGVGFVHRDLKPQNILLTGGTADPVKVSDFGLAKSFHQAGLSGLTVTGAAAGTPLFMPREQLTNFKYVKPVSDIWSVGATLYLMITGWLPRNFAAGRDALHTILHDPVVPVRARFPGAPPAIAEVVDRAISDDVEERFQTAAAFRDALAAAADRA